MKLQEPRSLIVHQFWPEHPLTDVSHFGREQHPHLFSGTRAEAPRIFLQFCERSKTILLAQSFHVQASAESPKIDPDIYGLSKRIQMCIVHIYIYAHILCLLYIIYIYIHMYMCVWFRIHELAIAFHLHWEWDDRHSG